MAVSAEQLQQQIEDLTNLPTLPAVVQFIITRVEEDNTSAQEIGKIIARDQVLSAKILRMVNSPFYGFPGRISSVTHAIVLLGFNVVKGLVLSTAVFDTLAKETRGLWEHSLGTAVLSRRLAKELGLPESDEIMIAGLLHDLGKVVLSFLVPKDYRAARRHAESNGCHIAVAENELLGFDHARVGQWVAIRWNLPQRLTDAMAFHHDPSRAKFSRDTAAVVQLADILARGLSYGDGGDPTMPPLDHAAFRALDISFEAIDSAIKEAEIEFSAGVDLFTNRG